MLGKLSAGWTPVVVALPQLHRYPAPFLPKECVCVYPQSTDSPVSSLIRSWELSSSKELSSWYSRLFDLCIQEWSINHNGLRDKHEVRQRARVHWSIQLHTAQCRSKASPSGACRALLWTECWHCTSARKTHSRARLKALHDLGRAWHPWGGAQQEHISHGAYSRIYLEL